MGNYQNLKSSIAQVIRNNGNNEITGDILGNILALMVDSLGNGATFKGLADLNLNPGNPDSKVFYIATIAGTYRYFDNLQVTDEVAIFINDSGSWESLETGIPLSVDVFNRMYRTPVYNKEISDACQYCKDLENFIIDIKITGNILGTESDPHYWSPISVHVGGTEKQRVLLYRVDAEGNYLTGSNTDSITINLLGSELSYVLNQDVKDKNGLTGKVSMVVDWTLWKHGKQEAMKPLRLNDDVLKDHFGLISILENVKITTDNVKPGYKENINSLDVYGWNNGEVTGYYGDNGFIFKHPNVVDTSNSRGIRTNVFTPDPNYKCVLTFEIDSVVPSGNLTVYVYGSKNGQEEYLAAQAVKSGKNTFEFDPAYYAVYKGYDSFFYIMAVSGIEGSNYDISVYVNNFLSAQYMNGDYDNLTSLITAMQSKINDLEGRINTLESSDRIILTAPNGQKYIIQCNNAGTIFTVPLYAEVVSYVGNSLLLGNGKFGMNATQETKDYAAIIGEKILEKGTGNYSAVKISGTTFEDATTQQEVNAWIEDVLTVDLDENSELVLIQLGDNINTPEKRSNFENTCSTLLSEIRKYCSKARVAWVYGWYVNNQVRSIIQEKCKLYGVDYIEINDLNTKENQSEIGAVITHDSVKSQSLVYDDLRIMSNKRLIITFSVDDKQYISDINVESYKHTPSSSTISWTGYETITVSGGVASHPGDLGFQKIAQRIMERLKF